MRLWGWYGEWPTDEYPPDGTKIRYLNRDGKIHETRILSIWCGIEPALELTDGATIFATLDKFELIND